MRLKHYLGLSEFLITCCLIAALKYVDTNDCLGWKIRQDVSWDAAEIWPFLWTRISFQRPSAAIAPIEVP